MKPLRIFLLLAGLLLASSRAEAQFSISKVTPKEADVKNFRDTIKQLSAVNNQFFSGPRKNVCARNGTRSPARSGYR